MDQIKKRSLSKSDIKNGKTIAILKELNFYNGITSQKSNKKESNNESASNDEIVNQLEALKKLFDDGVLSKDEFEKAKKENIKLILKSNINLTNIELNL